MGPDQKIALAMETEGIALAEKDITNSHGASFETKEVKTFLANSNGFLNGYEETVCSLSLGLQAGDTDTRAEGYWFSAQRHFEDIESPEVVAKKAVDRTLRQLNPKKIKTQSVPVLFEPMMTSWLLGFLFACVSGIAVYQKASFLADRLGKQIADEKINVFDDGLLTRKLGTRPFDSEGIPSQRTTVIQQGELRNFLCNTYAARKLGLESTANADGPSVGPNNFYLQPGKDLPSDMISSMDKGLILTRTIGHGLNPITGDISRAAFGLWVERGEICYPVSEITISGNLGDFLKNVEAVGNELDFRTSICGPSVLIKNVLVSGE
jgi:PmbA protein